MNCIIIRVLERSKSHSDDFNKDFNKRLLNNGLSKIMGTLKRAIVEPELEIIGSLTFLGLMEYLRGKQLLLRLNVGCAL